MDKVLALHETLDLHELLVFKNVSMTKSTTMQVLVSHDGLKDLMQSCAATDRRHIDELSQLLHGARIETGQEGRHPS